MKRTMFYLWITLMAAGMNFTPVRATDGVDHKDIKSTHSVEAEKGDSDIIVVVADNRDKFDTENSESNSIQIIEDNNQYSESNSIQSIEKNNQNVNHNHKKQDNSEVIENSVLKTGSEFVSALASSMYTGIRTIMHHAVQGISSVASWSNKKIGEYWPKDEKTNNSIPDGSSTTTHDHTQR